MVLADVSEHGEQCFALLTLGEVAKVIRHTSECTVSFGLRFAYQKEACVCSDDAPIPQDVFAQRSLALFRRCSV